MRVNFLFNSYNASYKKIARFEYYYIFIRKMYNAISNLEDLFVHSRRQTFLRERISVRRDLENA